MLEGMLCLAGSRPDWLMPLVSMVCALVLVVAIPGCRTSPRAPRPGVAEPATDPIHRDALFFFSGPHLKSPSISPDDEWLAFIRSNDPVDSVVVRRFRDSEERILVQERRSSRNTRRSRGLRLLGWSGGETLVCSTISPLRSREPWDRKEMGRGWRSNDWLPGVGVRARKTRLHAVGLDGRKRYVAKNWPSERQDQFQDHVLDWLPSDPGHILIEFEGAVFTVRVMNGQRHRVEAKELGLSDWRPYHLGRIRAVTVSKDKTTRKEFKARIDESSRLETILEYDPFEDDAFDVHGGGLISSPSDGHLQAIVIFSMTETASTTGSESLASSFAIFAMKTGSAERDAKEPIRSRGSQRDSVLSSRVVIRAAAGGQFIPEDGFRSGSGRRDHPPT